jgi:hypothetical protein
MLLEVMLLDVRLLEVYVYDFPNRLRCIDFPKCCDQKARGTLSPLQNRPPTSPSVRRGCRIHDLTRLCQGTLVPADETRRIR